ncbi:hypothetical protein [Nitrosomonas communis]|uniref:hypothetical protein n=1 Tax=Nitrosomonas communis TaxID=44574 RepID=UPI003D2CFCD9
MKAFSKLLIVLISSALVTITLPVYAGADEAVGQIEYFNGLPESYVIKRNNKKIFGMIGELIYGGDEIEVLEANKYIILNLGEKPTKISIGKNPIDRPINYPSPYKVSSEEKPYSSTTTAVLTNISKWASSLFTRWHEDDIRKIGKYIIRGTSDLQLPLLGVEEKIIIENKNLYLGWKGGRAPYRIRIYSEYDREPIIEKSVQENNIKLDSIALSPKSYGLRIDDADNKTVKANFTVISRDKLPSIPIEIKDSNLPEIAKKTLIATWLASQDNGKWTLESYQWVAGIGDEYYPARLLRDALEDGERPSQDQ